MERYSGSNDIFESHFRSKLKKKQWKSGQGTDEHFKPKWMFLEQLQFLVPTMKARQSRDTLKFDKDSAFRTTLQNQCVLVVVVQ